MHRIDVVDKTNKVVSQVDMPEGVFAVKPNRGLVHEAVIGHLANARQGTASTKTRGFVSGGGRKPFKQKGTGQARAGSTRSPLWRGGAILFGPTPRSYETFMPKKMRRAALLSALSAKFADGEVMVVDAVSVSEPKTKRVVEFLEALQLSGKLTIIIPDKDEVFERAARNLPSVSVKRVGQFGAYDIANGGKLVIDSGALSKMEEVYLK